MSEGGKEAVRADDEVIAASEVRRLEERVRGLERLLGGKTMEVEILKEALDLARAKKPILLSPSPPRPRRLWEIPGEDGQRDTRCGPFECRRAPGQQEVAARPTRATRRCRACWRNPPLCRRASDLRVPEDRRAPQARAAIRRFAPGQCQARLPADEKAWPFARTPYRSPASTRARRPGGDDPVKLPLVLRYAGIRLLGNSPAGELPAGTERLCVSRSPSTATTARRSPGLQRPPASPAR